jgi:hypothetical protein
MPNPTVPSKPAAQKPAAAPGSPEQKAERIRDQVLALDVKRVADWIGALVRTIKASRTYPANNPTLHKFQVELESRTWSCLKEVGDISLIVQQFDLLYENYPVYLNADRNESLAFRFYSDGVREITFREGLEPHELRAETLLEARRAELAGPDAEARRLHLVGGPDAAAGRPDLGVAGAALARAVVPGQRTRQQREAPVAEREEMPRHRLRGGAVVEPDRRMPSRGIDAPGEHVRASVIVEQPEQRGIVVDAHERERVHAVANELLGDAHLRREVVVVRREHQRVAALVERALQRAGGAGVERVVERRHDRADHLRALAAQRPRRPVRHVAELVDRGANALERVRVELVGQVERARDRRRRHAGQPRHVLGARARGRLGGPHPLRQLRGAHGREHTRAAIDFIWGGPPVRSFAAMQD